MSVLRAGNTTLEDGKVRICVPIAYETEKEILEESVRIGKSSVADIAEWRIDWYQDVFQPRKRNALAKKIRKNLQGKPLLVTFRSRREGGHCNGKLFDGKRRSNGDILLYCHRRTGKHIRRFDCIGCKLMSGSRFF